MCHLYNILNCSLISTYKVCGLGKGKQYPETVLPVLTTLGFLPRIKLCVITLFRRVMNNNVELCSDWLIDS